MNYVHRCYRCGQAVDSFVTHCNACRNESAIKDASRAASRESQRLAQQAFEMAEISARQAAANTASLMATVTQNARLAREQAAENTRLIVESNTSYDDAYQYGLNYLRCTDDGYRLFNTGKIDIYYVNVTADLNGDITVSRSVWAPYSLPHLNQAFDRGLARSARSLRLGRISRDKLRSLVYDAGWTFKTELFSLPVGVRLPSGREIETVMFNSTLKFQIDQQTGEWTVNGLSSLSVSGDSELDEEYRRGVREGLAAINTPEELVKNLNQIQENLEKEKRDTEAHTRATAARMIELKRRDRTESIKNWLITAGAVALPVVSFIAIGPVVGAIALVASAWGSLAYFTD